VAAEGYLPLALGQAAAVILDEAVTCGGNRTGPRYDGARALRMAVTLESSLRSNQQRHNSVARENTHSCRPASLQSWL
jgi:hypothetical protein